MGASFSGSPDRPWGPPSLLYNGYRVFSGGKVRPGRAADHSPPSSTEVLEEYSYTSTPLWGTTGPVTGLLYLFTYSTDMVRGFTKDFSVSRGVDLSSNPPKLQNIFYFFFPNVSGSYFGPLPLYNLVSLLPCQTSNSSVSCPIRPAVIPVDCSLFTSNRLQFEIRWYLTRSNLDLSRLTSPSCSP